VQDAGRRLKSALDSPTCIVLPREAGQTTARLAFSFTAESASLDENTPFHYRGFPSIHFWGSGCIVADPEITQQIIATSLIISV